MDCVRAKGSDCILPSSVDRPAGYLSDDTPGSSEVDVMEYLGLKRVPKKSLKDQKEGK